MSIALALPGPSWPLVFSVCLVYFEGLEAERKHVSEWEHCDGTVGDAGAGGGVPFSL